MKVRAIVWLMLLTFLFTLPVIDVQADEDSSSDLIRQGLLGAGAGAVGGAASGAKGRDVWKGALAGAGVNILGGALLDSISGEKVEKTQRVDSTQPRTAYSNGYEDGYSNGYKAGYTQGYKEGLKEAYAGSSSR